jgi:hypothetical protein
MKKVTKKAKKKTAKSKQTQREYLMELGTFDKELWDWMNE